MSEMLRPRLDRLQELSKNLNAATDKAARIVQGVETFLSDVCQFGMHCSILIAADHDDEGGTTEMFLVYGRFGPKFRLSVQEIFEHQGRPVHEESILWANCSREVKLLAYAHLSSLLDSMIKRAEERLQQIEDNTEAIESLLPPLTRKKPDSKSP